MAIVTMYAGDRMILRSVDQILQLAISQLGNLNHEHFSDGEAIVESIQLIESVKSLLNRVDSQAVSYQLPPGESVPS